MIDAIIRFDEELSWHEGRFVFLDRPDVNSLFSPEKCQILNSQYRLSIAI